MLIAASDGLQFLDDREDHRHPETHARQPAATIARALLDALQDLDDPAQDNISFTVIKTEAVMADPLAKLAADLVRASVGGG